MSRGSKNIKARVQWIARLLGISLLIVGFSEALITLSNDRARPAIQGVLTKHGPEYLVAWRTHDDDQVRAFRYPSLSEAVEQIHRLKLRPGRPPKSYRLERLWLSKGAKGSEVHWKHSRNGHTHRLTFKNPADAKFFFNAFELGAYTQSRFGHAIQLNVAR